MKFVTFIYYSISPFSAIPFLTVITNRVNTINNISIYHE